MVKYNKGGIMTKEEMCAKCRERFKETFDEEKCKTCAGIAFVETIDKGLEMLELIRNNADTIAKVIVRHYLNIQGKEENK